VAAWANTRMVLERSKSGIVGSNSAGGMDVYVAFFWVVLSCLGGGLVMGRSAVQGVLPNFLNGFKTILNRNRPEGLTRVTYGNGNGNI
jgi:hypothetical protein